jgi:hypothetical protein
MLALIAMSYSLLPLQPTDSPPQSHPPFRWRLQVLREFMPDFIAGFESEFDEFVGAVGKMSPYRSEGDAKSNGTSLARMFQRIVRPLAKSIAAEVVKLNLNKFDATKESLKRCQNRLRDHLPIGAQGVPRDVLRRRVDTFKGRRYNTDRERQAAFSALLPGFSESPLNIALILAAAFSRRSNIVSEFCHSRVSLRIDEHCGALHRLDALVSNSIRSSSIHRQLISHTINDAATPDQSQRS